MAEKKQYLYRYRHLHGDHREWTRKIFTDSVLHFANPSDFNYPFDCRVHYRNSFSMEEFKSQHLERIKQRMPALNRRQRRAKASYDLKAMNREQFLADMTTRLQDTVNSVGVLSLSATDRNILLWSHYAAGHTGLCLKFEAADHTPFFGRALPVTYMASYPEISVVSSASEHVDAFLLTKAIDWAYEKEYRIIDHDYGAGDKKYPSELLLGVIFGARMAAADKKVVSEWVSICKSGVELLEASVVPGTFSLDIRPYKG
jgi:hypothetical protein